ncbi:MAG: ACP S-malonyltransferase [bacterium]|nr:ACP S-malonyltransferase [bacterium]
MSNSAIVFPGQGSQKVGMGADLYEKYKEVRDFFDEADSILGRNITKICFEGPAEELVKTTNTQPAIFLVSAALLKVLIRNGHLPKVVAGHSLGELSAYYAAGVFDLKTALNIIVQRAESMERSYPAENSAMAAVIGMKEDKIRHILNDFSGSPVVIANYNSPDQIVISGEKEGLTSACRIIKDQGARAIPLKVSGAFHSPLMQQGSDELREHISDFVFNDAEVPVVLNRTGEEETISEALKKNLPLQIVSSVLWVKSIQTIQSKVDSIIECGPGKVLSGLIKKISPGKQVFNIYDNETMNIFLDA